MGNGGRNNPLLDDFKSSSRISSLINKMTKNNQHLEMLKRKVEKY